MSKDTSFIRYMNPFDKNPVGRCSQRTWERSRTRKRDVLIWNSSKQGTFHGDVKRDLINKS